MCSVARLARAPIHFFRFLERSAQAVQFRDAILRHRCVARIAPRVEARAGVFRFGERLLPGPLQLQHLGPANETLAPEREHVGMRVAPCGECRRPLLRASQIEQFVTRTEHAAVDDPGDERTDFAARDADHHLVEHRQAGSGLVREEQHASLPVSCKREEVAVLESRANLRSVAERGLGRDNIIGSNAQERLRAQKKALLGAFVRAFIEEPPCSCEPPRSGSVYR